MWPAGRWAEGLPVRRSTPVTCRSASPMFCWSRSASRPARRLRHGSRSGAYGSPPSASLDPCLPIAGWSLAVSGAGGKRMAVVSRAPVIGTCRGPGAARCRDALDDRSPARRRISCSRRRTSLGLRVSISRREHAVQPPQPPPVRRPIMYQHWRRLTFLHWRYPVGTVQRLLPAGLRVHTFDGSAWVGLIPFLMNRVRAPGTPSLPWLSRFPETNVRTYV